MKLAEAIQEKTNLKKTISDLRERLEKAAGAAEKTNENPVRLLGDLEESLKRIVINGAEHESVGTRGLLLQFHGCGTK